MVELIEAAERAGTLDHDTALVYELYAALDAQSLPPEFQSLEPDAPEATSVMAELVAQFDDLSPVLQAKVQPFLMRPTEPGNFWSRKDPRPTAMARTLSGSEPIGLTAEIDGLGFAYVDVVSPTPIRIWYATWRGETEKQLAIRLANEIDTSDMWGKETDAMLGRQPCSDLEQAEPRNAGSAALDIYLISPSLDLDWHGRIASLVRTDKDTGKVSNVQGVTVTAEAGTHCTWITYMVVNTLLLWDDLRATVAHELFHSFQLSLNMSGEDDRSWWMESTATWAEDLVYPQLNTEQVYLPRHWSQTQGPEGPLDDLEGTAEYGAYLWPFYLRQAAGGDATEIGRLWKATVNKSPMDVMRDMPGWADKFKQFALWNWNQGPVTDYRDNGAEVPTSVLSQHAGCLKDACILKVGKQDLYIDLATTSVEYYRGELDTPVEQLRFDLSGLSSKAGAGIQAIISIGQPGRDAEVRTEDWTGLGKRIFCIAREDVRDVVLVISNSGTVPETKLNGKIGIEALADHCGGGIATFTRTQSSHTVATDACTGQSVTTDKTSETSMVVSFQADGSGTATVSQALHSVQVSVATNCDGGAGQVTTTIVDAHVAGTKATDVTWSIDEDGLIDFYAEWDVVGPGSSVTSIECSPEPCTGVTTGDYYADDDALYFTAQGDPTKQVITGSTTEDMSPDGGSDIVVYSWTLER